MAKAKKAETEEELDDKKAGAEGEEAAEGEEGAKPKKSKKKLIIIAAIAVLLIGGGGGAFLFLHKSDKAEGGEEVAVDEHGNPIANAAVFYTMPEFLVNLNSSGKSSQFLKATVILEVEKQTDVATIEAALPRIVDGINTYLRELRSSDVAGSAGIQRLREEILLRVNKAIAPKQINDVLFKEIVVQ